MTFCWRSARSVWKIKMCVLVDIKEMHNTHTRERERETLSFFFSREKRRWGLLFLPVCVCACNEIYKMPEGRFPSEGGHFVLLPVKRSPCAVVGARTLPQSSVWAGRKRTDRFFLLLLKKQKKCVRNEFWRFFEQCKETSFRFHHQQSEEFAAANRRRRMERRMDRRERERERFRQHQHQQSNLNDRVDLDARTPLAWQRRDFNYHHNSSSSFNERYPGNNNNKIAPTSVCCLFFIVHLFLLLPYFSCLKKISSV